MARDDLPTIVANIMADRERDVELWIRPEPVPDSPYYTVEWTTLDYDQEELEWRPAYDRSTTVERDGVFSTRARQLLSRIIANLTERMPTFDVDRTEINLFEIEGRYLFKHYFEQDELFAELRRYYNEADYRFEVPPDAFDEVQDLLHDQFYEPMVVDDLERFCVVHRKYAEHPDVLFKASVLQRTQGDYHVFLMKDQLSVEQAVNSGADRLGAADVDMVF